MPYAALALFAALFAWFGLPWMLAAAYAVLSLACFIAYAVDKAAARARRQRTPERTLLLLGLAGGWPGAVLAQQWLRHKSAKTAFQVRFWATVAVNCAVLAFIWIWST
jgi:uncharacterized membrane protein YsdA (DUF1294 family)